MKKRLFNWRVKGSLIITAALIIGSIILAVALSESGSDMQELQALFGGMSGG